MQSLITSCMHWTCKSSRVIYSDVVEAKIVTNLPFINHIFFCALLLVVMLLCINFSPCAGCWIEAGRCPCILESWVLPKGKHGAVWSILYVFLWLLCICIFFVSSITSWKQMATANVIFNYGFTWTLHRSIISNN